VADHWVWQSTIHKLIAKEAQFGIQGEVEAKFARFNVVERQDKPVQITDEEKTWLDTLCLSMPYPACSGCGKSLCGNAMTLCGCAIGKFFQQDYAQAAKTLQANENAFQKVLGKVFRQSRNAYGEGGIIFGAIKILFAPIVAFIGYIATCALLVALPIVATLWVYGRGRREEIATNKDGEADLMEKKINFLCKHQDSVRKRQEYFLKNPSAMKNSLQLKSTPRTSVKPHKEKRGILGNPFSHFFASGFATYIFLQSCVTFGIFGILTTFLSGGIGLGLIIGAALITGLVFGILRYQNLQAKIAYEKQLAILAAQENDLNVIQETIQNDSQSRKSLEAVQLSTFGINQALTAQPPMSEVKLSQSPSTPTSPTPANVSPFTTPRPSVISHSLMQPSNAEELTAPLLEREPVTLSA